MRHSMFWALALTASLSVVACKKAEPEATPTATAPAPAPAVSWSWGPATFDGSRAEGNDGKLMVPFGATNNSDVGFVLDVVSVTILDAAGEKVCTGKVSVDDKATKGNTIEGKVEVDCSYQKLPEGADLPGKATVMYKLNGEEKQDIVDVKIPFKR